MDQKVKFEISTWAVAKVFLIAILFYLFFLVQDIVALFFVVLILTATFSPVVKSWSKYLGRTLSIVSLFLLFLASIAAVIYLIIPPLVIQTTQLANSIPEFVGNINFESIKPYVPSIKSSLDSFSSNIGALGSNIFSFTANLFSGIFTVLMIFVLTYYMLIDETNIKKYISSLLPADHREDAISVINKIASKVGSWFRGQMFLGIIIFVVDYIGLSIIGVPYALILALIAGLLELIPTVGPIISGSIATIVALTISPWKALFVVAFYFLIQMFENLFLVPKVMQKAVGISPVVIILAIFIGAKLFGILGAMLSVPLAASLSVVILEWPVISRMFSKN